MSQITTDEQLTQYKKHDDYVLTRFLRFGVLAVFFILVMTVGGGFLHRYLTDTALQEHVHSLIEGNLESLFFGVIVLVMTGSILKK